MRHDLEANVTILGVNAHHGDASACLVVDGVVVAAVEEERLNRVRHWAGFPAAAIRSCLSIAGIAPDQIGHVAINRSPGAHVLRKAAQLVRGNATLKTAVDRFRNARRVVSLEDDLRSALALGRGPLPFRVHRVEHHMAHLASAFYPSPFESAAVASIDGFGDFVSCMWGRGHGTTIQVSGRIHFPHSLGQLYLVLSQFLGFPRFGDEGKVMGLAAYGRPVHLERLRALVRPGRRGAPALEGRFFRHVNGGVPMTWDEGTPEVGVGYTDDLVELLGDPRRPDEPVDQRHMDLAASTQALFEEEVYRLLDRVARDTGESRLALAGGCALNSLANGRIVERTPFRELYVPSAPADAGGAIGAALAVWHEPPGRRRSARLEHAFLGPLAGDEQIRAALDELVTKADDPAVRRRELRDEDEAAEEAAARLAGGEVVGWVQGRMEFGPRALGHRSILADPRRADCRELLNRRVKLREPFRPFAPAVLREHAAAWFEGDFDSPFMCRVVPVRRDRAAEIPAVTHVDGTARVQTVGAENPHLRRVIAAFARRTGVPILLNTSFNENEPIVCSPADALRCFLRTEMDALVLGRHLVHRERDR